MQGLALIGPLHAAGGPHAQLIGRVDRGAAGGEPGDPQAAVELCCSWRRAPRAAVPAFASAGPSRLARQPRGAPATNGHSHACYNSQTLGRLSTARQGGGRGQECTATRDGLSTPAHGDARGRARRRAGWPHRVIVTTSHCGKREAAPHNCHWIPCPGEAAGTPRGAGRGPQTPERVCQPRRGLRGNRAAPLLRLRRCYDSGTSASPPAAAASAPPPVPPSPPSSLFAAPGAARASRSPRSICSS